MWSSILAFEKHSIHLVSVRSLLRLLAWCCHVRYWRNVMRVQHHSPLLETPNKMRKWQKTKIEMWPRTVSSQHVSAYDSGSKLIHAFICLSVSITRRFHMFYVSFLAHFWGNETLYCFFTHCWMCGVSSFKPWCSLMHHQLASMEV